MGADALLDFLRQIGAAIKHGQRHTQNFEARVEGAAHPFHRLGQPGQTLERVILGL